LRGTGHSLEPRTRLGSHTRLSDENLTSDSAACQAKFLSIEDMAPFLPREELLENMIVPPVREEP